jgi:hypothetical protein
MALGIEDRVWLLLEWEVNVEESSERVDRHTMLRMVEEIFLAALIAGVPFEDVEMGVLRTLRCTR